MSVIVNEETAEGLFELEHNKSKAIPGLNTELRTKQCVQNRAQET